MNANGNNSSNTGAWLLSELQSSDRKTGAHELIHGYIADSHDGSVYNGVPGISVPSLATALTHGISPQYLDDYGRIDLTKRKMLPQDRQKIADSIHKVKNGSQMVVGIHSNTTKYFGTHPDPKSGPRIDTLK
ncbi:MAG: hypothetical protein AAF587_40615 [Bacteroidota bacterium]